MLQSQMATRPKLSLEWMSWIQENLKRNCPPHLILETMLKAQFDQHESIEAIKSQQRILRSRQAAIEKGILPSLPRKPDEFKKSKSLFEKVDLKRKFGSRPQSENLHNKEESGLTSNSLIFEGRKIPLIFELKEPRIRIYDSFLLPSECEELVYRSKTRLSASRAVDPVTGQSLRFSARTSEGTYFPRFESGLIDSIERRCAWLSGYHPVHGESLQVIKYPLGTEYQPHYDFFDPRFPGNAQQLMDGGQRIATVLMYLNDVEEGGDTFFPDIGVSINPRKGQAVIFYNVDSLNQLDPRTRHASRPVIAGEKWIATKWIRQLPRKS